MSKFALLLLSILALSLVGCDSIPFLDNTDDYKSAGRGRPLEVPPDLTTASADDTYKLPGGTTYSSYSQDRDAQAHQEEKLLPSPDGVKMERAGSQRWLVVPAAPEKVWPIVRDFWTELGFAVRVENTQTGVMETEWIDPSTLSKDDQQGYLDKFQSWMDKLSALNNRQKFRTRIDRGNDDETTEIYMTHRSLSDAIDDGKDIKITRLGRIDNGYKKKDDDAQLTNDAAAAELDIELLRRLMVKLGVADKQARAIIATPSQELRASLTKQKDGASMLVLNDSFDRAWRRVGLALDRIGFLVEDRDRSKGLFFVRYSDIEADYDEPKKEKGLLDKLAFWNDDEDEKPKAKPAPKKKKDDSGFVDKLKFWESDKEKAAAEAQYRILIARGSDTSAATVVDKEGKRDNSPTANRILALLYEQLR